LEVDNYPLIDTISTAPDITRTISQVIATYL